MVVDTIFASCPASTPKVMIESSVPLPEINLDGLNKQREFQIEQLRTLNQAWKNQSNFISCTTDFRAPRSHDSLQSEDLRKVSSCEEDLSGPFELKACVNHRACYLYHWNTEADRLSSSQARHFADRPQNWEYFLKTSSGITIADIIASAVGKYDLARAQTGSKEWKQLYEASLKNWNPSAPGVWEVPVCVSEYNWNTPVEPIGSKKDIQRRQPVPCNCGPLGKDTSRFWEQMGFGRHHYQRVDLCEKRIKQRIPDQLERMIARCSLEIRRTYAQWIHGTEKYCKSWFKRIDESGVRMAKELDQTDRAWMLGQAGKDAGKE